MDNKISEEVDDYLDTPSISDGMIINHCRTIKNKQRKSHLNEPGESIPDGQIHDNLNEDKFDLNTIRTKRVELDSIQEDLDTLMYKLNGFALDSDTCSEGDFSVQDSEKQDGPPEKELKAKPRAQPSAVPDGKVLMEKLCSCGGDCPPEFNFDVITPVLQKHVTDLQRLLSLNQMTNEIVKRIRNVTEIRDAFLQKTTKTSDKM